MKKQIFSIVAIALMLAAPASVSAQSSLTNVLNSLKKSSSSSSSSSSSDDSSSSSSSSSLLSTITSIFSSSKTATTSKLVGTWTYSEPAIVFESDNVLSNVAAKAAANKIESTLQSSLEKYGITAGAMTLTFSEDSTFTATIKSKTTSGTWTIEDSALKLSFSSSSSKSVSVTTQCTSSTLQLVTDASSLLSLVKGIASSSSNSNLQTISSLMSNVDGMQVGLTFTK